MYNYVHVTIALLTLNDAECMYLSFKKIILSDGRL